MAGYREMIAAAVRAVDSRLRADQVAAAIERVAAHREQRRILAAAVSTDPAWFAGSVTAPPVVERLVGALQAAGSARFEFPRCGTCGRTARSVGRAADGTRMCKACDHKRRTIDCARCGRHRPAGLRLPGGHAVCASCARSHPDRLEPCVDCGEARIVHRRWPGGGSICPRCYMRRARALDDNLPGVRAVCASCGREGYCVAASTGRPSCPRCYPKRSAPCARCGRTRRVAVVWAAGPHCDRCRHEVLDSRGSCQGCGLTRRIDPRNRDGRQACSACAGLEPFSTCTTCGAEARLWERGSCSGCTLRRRLDRLFAAAAPAVAGRLAPLRAVLGPGGDHRVALDWLCRAGSGRLLAQLFDGTVEVSHQALDQVGTQAAGHLRALLVAAGILVPRDEQLARLERWITTQVGAIPDPGDRHMMATFTTWQVLRRRRQRAARGGGTGETGASRRTVLAAISLLAWLRARQRPLADITQADIDLWLAGPPGRRNARQFLTWAAARRLAPKVTIAARPASLPAATITTEQLAAFVHRMATDTSVPTVERAAGLLIALYGQPATRLVRLTADAVARHDGQVWLRLGRHQADLPPLLAGLIAELAAGRKGRARIGATASPWLFPGGQPGRPLTARWLAARITAHGLPVTSLRSAALLELAAELPASFLADLLGISPGTAVRWSRAAGGDWASYAAIRARSPASR